MKYSKMAICLSVLCALGYAHAMPAATEVVDGGRPPQYQGQGPTAGQIQVPAQPAQPVLQLEKREDIERRAREAAGNFIEAVVRNLGQVEGIRYNVFLGFQNAKRWSSEFGKDYTSLQEYTDGLESGKEAGKEKGGKAGLERASLWGSELADRDLGIAVDNALSGQTNGFIAVHTNGLDKIDAPQLTYQGSVPASVEDRLKAQDQQIQQNLNQFFQRDNNVVFADDLISGRIQVYQIYDMKEFQFDLLQSYFRDTDAFNSWAAGNFQSRQSKSLDYYHEISDASRFQRADMNEQYFRNAFQDYYNQKINKRWNDAVTYPRTEVQRVGEDLFINLTKQYASEMGVYDGINQTFGPASVPATQNNIQGYYDHALQADIEQMKNNPKLTDEAVSIFTSNNASEVTIGDSLNISLDAVSNRGMVDGTVTMIPTSNSQVTAVKGTMTQTIGALSKLKKSVSISDVYRVSGVDQADGQVTFELVVDGRSFTRSIKNTFEGLVVGIVHTQDQNVKAKMVSTLVKFLASEWSNKKAVFGNGFDASKGNLLIKRLATRISVMTASEKAEIQKYKMQIRSAYGERPSAWKFWYKGDYDSAMSVLSQAGL
jgi:hypothetical protein